MLGLLIPLSLAAGNIYRTMDWPDATGPAEPAAGNHVAAAAMLLAAILLAADASGKALSLAIEHRMRVTCPIILMSDVPFGSWDQYLPRNPAFL